MTRQPRPFAGRPGEGERRSFGGTTIIIRASAEMTGGGFTMFEETTPLLDTPRHVHRNEDELYYVVEGEHVYQCGDEEFQVGPGGLVFLPRGIPHAHRRVVPRTGRLIVMTFRAGSKGSSGSWPRRAALATLARPRTPGPRRSTASPGSTSGVAGKLMGG